MPVGEVTKIANAKVPYSALVKGDFKYELHGLPENVNLKHRSTMGEATLEDLIERSACLSFKEKETGQRGTGNDNSNVTHRGETVIDENRNDELGDN